MGSNLYELIKKSQFNDEESILFLIEKFSPIIKSISIKLNYDCAETDLIIFFIQLIRSIDLSNFKNEGALVNYISISLKNKSKELFRKNIKNQLELTTLNLDISHSDNSNHIMLSDIFVSELLDCNLLTVKQKYVLEQSYIKYKSDLEIADLLNISRQAVNRLRRSGLKNLREQLLKNVI